MRPPIRHPRPVRRGLAPLELVLSLPLLLMVMALMVIVGAAGAWKVRTLANSRQAVFRAMFPRSTDNDPVPPNYWPASASLQYTGGGSSPFPADPFAEHIVVRGPTFSDPETGHALNVRIRTMDMTAGMTSGRATINHDSAMWPQLNARNRFTRDNVMFAGHGWQFHALGIPYNDSRRILYTYDYEMSRYNPEAAAATNAAAQDLRSNPNRAALAVLDRDAELRWWFGHNIDFHPYPNNICSNDPARLRQQVLLPLLARIDNVPRRMATTFLSMYRTQLQLLNEMDPQPPDADARRASLMELIRQLEDFLQTL